MNTSEFFSIKILFFFFLFHFLLIFCFVASMNAGKFLVIYDEASAAKYTIWKIYRTSHFTFLHFCLSLCFPRSFYFLFFPIFFFFLLIIISLLFFLHHHHLPLHLNLLVGCLNIQILRGQCCLHQDLD